MNVTESYQNIKYTISSRQLSDGMLRLLAFIGLSQSEDGKTVAKKLFDIPELQEKLEYMYPGEIFYNIPNQEIVDLCMKQTD